MNIREKQIKKYYQVKRQNQNGVKIDDACKNAGICKATYYSYKTKIELEKKKCKDNGIEFVKYYGKESKITSAKKSDPLFTSKSSKSLKSSKLLKSQKTPIKSITKSQMSTNPDDYDIDLIDKPPKSHHTDLKKKKPVEQCSKREIRDELKEYYDKYL
jgi:hypothetical protein